MNVIIRRATRLLPTVLLLFLVGGCSPEPRVPEVLETIPTRGKPMAVVANSQTGYVYITNGNEVAVFQDDRLIANLPTTAATGPRPSLAVDENGDWVYVVNQYDDSVTVIRGTEVVTTVETAGREPCDVIVEPRSGWAYVVSGYRKSPPRGQAPVVEGNVTVISGTQVVGIVPLGRVLAIHVVADPVNGYVYVGSVGGDVIIIDGLEEVARFNIGSTVLAMDADPRTGDVYILDADGHLLRVQGVEIAQQVDLWEEGPSPRNMRVHPVTGNVYIVYGGSWMLIVRDMEVIGDLEVGWGALKIAIDPLTGNVYVANFRDDTVAVVHGTEVLATIDVGWYPYGIGVNPANGWVYVSNTNEHSVTILGFREGE